MSIATFWLKSESSWTSYRASTNMQHVGFKANTSLVVVSNMFYFHSWGHDPIWRSYFSRRLKPPTSNNKITLHVFVLNLRSSGAAFGLNETFTLLKKIIANQPPIQKAIGVFLGDKPFLLGWSLPIFKAGKNYLLIETREVDQLFGPENAPLLQGAAVRHVFWNGCCRVDLSLGWGEGMSPKTLPRQRLPDSGNWTNS